MQIKRLDHVNIVTTRLDDMVAWYSDILGLKPGWRPDFDFPGAWLYAGDNAVVHLIGTDETGAVGAESRLKLEHFAFSAQGREGFESRLKSGDHPYRLSVNKEIGVVAFNVWDPDGNHIHVDFDLQE